MLVLLAALGCTQELEAQNAELVSRVDALEAELAALSASTDADYVDLSEEVAAITEGVDLTDLQDQVVANTDAITLLDAEVASAQDAITVNAAAAAANADGLATLGDAVATNTADVATNAGAIDANAEAIASNTTAIASNVSGISTNASAISSNSGDISTNAGDISTNTSDIADLEDAQGTMLSDVDWMLLEWHNDDVDATVSQGHAGMLFATSGGAFYHGGYISATSLTSIAVFFATFYVTNPSSSDVTVDWTYCAGDSATISVDGTSVATPGDADGACTESVSFTLTPGDHEVTIRYRDSNNFNEGFGVANSWIGDYGLETDIDALETALASGL